MTEKLSMNYAFCQPVNAAEEIKRLKNQDGPMLQVHGSGGLIQTLLKNDLADELWLKIFPLTLILP